MPVDNSVAPLHALGLDRLLVHTLAQIQRPRPAHGNHPEPRPDPGRRLHRLTADVGHPQIRSGTALEPKKLPQLQRQLHMIKGCLDVALRTKERVVRPQLKLRKRRARAKLHPGRRRKMRIRPPTIHDHPQISILLFHKKRADHLGGIIQNKFHHTSRVKPPQKLAPVLRLLHRGICVASVETKCLQPLLGEIAWQDLRLAEIPDKLSAALAPQHLQRCGHSALCGKSK